MNLITKPKKKYKNHSHPLKKYTTRQKTTHLCGVTQKHNTTTCKPNKSQKPTYSTILVRKETKIKIPHLCIITFTTRYHIYIQIENSATNIVKFEDVTIPYSSYQRDNPTSWTNQNRKNHIPISLWSNTKIIRNLTTDCYNSLKNKGKKGV